MHAKPHLGRACRPERLNKHGVQRRGTRTGIDLGLDGGQAESGERDPLLPAQNERGSYGRHGLAFLRYMLAIDTTLKPARAVVWATPHFMLATPWRWHRTVPAQPSIQ